MGVTIRDVADEAEVSATTVSRVFNHDHLVNTETRQHVLSVAREMGYAPNATARSLSNGRTRSIGVILPAPHGEFFSELLRGLDEAAQEAGYFLVIASSHYDPEEGVSALESIAGRVDGLVMMTPRARSRPLTQAVDLDLPVVRINSGPGTGEFDLFSMENRAGAAHVVRHMIEQGGSRVAAITGPPGSYDVERRMDGYRQAVREHDSAEEGRVIEGDFTQKSGYEAGQQIAALDPRPDAVFACNDYMAIGAMLAFQEAGIRVPDEIAVAGFDDITSARYANPPLTTVKVPVYELGRQSVERLLHRIQARTSPEPEQSKVSHELKVRASTSDS
ncbi:MAG: LacI family DNA-binding transcriptional regulator [Salinibacter sp.]|uniref:LacI family DNA-binding transcriptional regulator n=1 Tax=Salinibacter sp. TaxID=2065818 RepID=UPI002FC2C639